MCARQHEILHHSYLINKNLKIRRIVHKDVIDFTPPIHTWNPILHDVEHGKYFVPVLKYIKGDTVGQIA
jgi:hypothetical protein